MKKDYADLPYNGSRFSAPQMAFLGYCLFMMSYLLHFTARLPILGKLRFDLLLAAGLLGLMLLSMQRFKKTFQSPIARSLLTLLVYIFVSLPFVEWPGSVINTNFVIWLKAAVFFFFTAAFVDTERRLKIVVIIYIFCQTFRVLEPLYLNLTTGYWGSKTYIGDGSFAARLGGAPSDIVNPNGLAFVICIAWTWWHYLVGTLDKKKWQFVYLGVIGAFALTMVLTMSRTGFIGLLVILFIIFLQSKRKWLFILLGVVGVTVAVANMSDVQKDRYLSLTGNEDVVGADTANGRMQFMTRMMNVWLLHPIVGHGLGTSAEAGANAGSDAKIAHSLYLEVLIELGLVGFLIYCGFLWQIYKSLRKLQSRLVDAQQQLASSQFQDVSLHFELQTTRAITTLMWMMGIFSIAYFGFSREWWYFLAAVTMSLNLHVEHKLAYLNKVS